MPRVIVTAIARADLRELIRTHSLPADTEARVARSLRPLAEFPLLGPELEGALVGRRFILGPWRWLVIVYRVYEQRDFVAVLAMVDASSAGSPLRNRDSE